MEFVNSEHFTALQRVNQLWLIKHVMLMQKVTLSLHLSLIMFDITDSSFRIFGEGQLISSRKRPGLLLGIYNKVCRELISVFLFDFSFKRDTDHSNGGDGIPAFYISASDTGYLCVPFPLDNGLNSGPCNQENQVKIKTWYHLRL